MKEKLLGKTLEELRLVAEECGLPRFAAGQMAQWLYVHGVSCIDEMTNLSKQGRQQLSERYEVGRMPHSLCQTSVDGTKKYLFPTSGGKHVESVFIPDKDRATLCVSSQIGCRMGCKFCASALGGFVLSAFPGKVAVFASVVGTTGVVGMLVFSLLSMIINPILFIL